MINEVSKLYKKKNIMSIPRRGIRKIRVDDIQYEWNIHHRERRDAFYDLNRLVAGIQLATEGERGVLVVDFGVTPPGNKRDPHKTSVTPKTIEEVIRKAISDGWKPNLKSTFKMDFKIPYVGAT